MTIDKKYIFTIFACILMILSGTFCYFFRDYIEFPVSKDIVLDSPYIVRDYDNYRYILDKQRTRIVVTDKHTNIVKSVLPQGINNADVFYCADDFLIDETGFVYVKEGAWDGNRVCREAVLIYDDQGRYVSTCLDVHYGEEAVNKHKMMLLSVRAGKLHYSIKEDSSIFICSYDLKTQKDFRREYKFENAFDFVNDMAEDSAGNVYVLDKTGRLFELDSENKAFNLIFTAGADDFPNWIEGSGIGKLLYADLYSDSVIELDLKSGSKNPVIEGSGSVTVTPVAFSDMNNPLKNQKILNFQVLSLIVAGVFAVSSLIFLILLVVIFFTRKMHIIQRISFYIIIIVIAISGVLTYKLTEEFSKVMKNQILAQMENMAYSVANTIKPSDLASIQTAADFASDSYRGMIADMQKIIDTNLEINRNVYCDVFKYDEKRGAYACAYLDQTIGTYFPLTPGEIEEVKQIYETGKSFRSSKDDTSASYTYASVPVMDENRQVCGVVSVMLESCVLTSQIDTMRKNVLVGIIITIIFVWLIMGEALSYILSKSQAQMEMQEKAIQGEKVEKVFPHYYIRLMVFALFAAYNMTTTFIPMVVAKGAFETLGENCGNFIAALPLSVNLFALGLMALFCESFIRKLGVKKVLVGGTVLSALANMILFEFASSYFMIFFALIVDGIGVGLATNSMYLMVSQIPDAKNRTSGYTAYNAAQISGINFGMLFGAALALNIGRHLIFPLVTLMWIVTALLFLLLWSTLGVSTEGMQKSDEMVRGMRKSPKVILSFLCHKSIWSFIICVQAPFALMGGFIYYYLPLYSESNNLSEVIVAVLMMLYSMFAIYLGNGLTKWIIKKTGAFSPYASIFLSALAVVVYAVLGNFVGLLSAVFILGLANGFGRSVQQAHFSMLEECENFGVPESMGIYNFTDFIGQSFGPAVMAAIFLSRNILVSAGIFAAVLIVLSVFHATINLSKRKN